MFKRYVLGFEEINRFVEISSSKCLQDLIEVALHLHIGAPSYKFVIYDRKKRVNVFVS